jgi:hypothetical protein
MGDSPSITFQASAKSEALEWILHNPNGIYDLIRSGNVLFCAERLQTERDSDIGDNDDLCCLWNASHWQPIRHRMEDLIQFSSMIFQLDRTDRDADSSE